MHSSSKQLVSHSSDICTTTKIVHITGPILISIQQFLYVLICFKHQCGLIWS